jgi:hypothetical protein
MALTDFLGDAFYAQNPTATFYNQFGGASGFGTKAEFLRSRQNPLYNQYQAGLPQNPNQSFMDFLRPFNLEGEFQALAPRQRGEFPGMYSPRVEYRDRRF